MNAKTMKNYELAENLGKKFAIFCVCICDILHLRDKNLRCATLTIINLLGQLFLD